jgi:hypothetical protein
MDEDVRIRLDGFLKEELRRKKKRPATDVSPETGQSPPL